MMTNRKPITESEMAQVLARGEVLLPPLQITPSRSNAAGRLAGWDLELLITWSGMRANFVAECKANSTPKALEDAIRKCRDRTLPADLQPMVIMPYLRESQLYELEEENISGIDLCGNGYVIVPKQFAVFRTGQPNKFPTYAPIKNIYRRNTSMVARAFLTKPHYASVQEVHDVVNRKNLLVAHWHQTPIGLSTVSKALRGLEDDLIIDRSNGIRLIQADKLLEELKENYRPPRLARKLRMKVEVNSNELPRLIGDTARRLNLPIVATGLASVTRYAVMQRDEMLSIYSPQIDSLINALSATVADRFPNLELIETDEQLPFFDAKENTIPWASPIQTFLELSHGDKRDVEAAQQVRDSLIRQIGRNK